MISVREREFLQLALELSACSERICSSCEYFADSGDNCGNACTLFYDADLLALRAIFERYPGFKESVEYLLELDAACKYVANKSTTQTKPDVETEKGALEIIKNWGLTYCLGKTIENIEVASGAEGKERDVALHAASRYLRMELENA